MVYTPDKSTWFNPNIEYLFNTEIIEYDMQSAGLSLIKKYQLLDADEIFKLNNLSKGELNVAVGKIQRDRPGFSHLLLEKFTLARGEFILDNKLTDDQIVSVKKDAIFTVGRCPITNFGMVTFIPKHTYSSYVRFTGNSNIEIYYSDTDLEIKGIGEIGLSRHRLYMVDFIRRIIKLLESRDPSTRRYLRTFIDSYRANELDDGYYLEFNNLSQSINPVFNFTNLIVPFIQIAVREISP